ncbi:MAG: alpha/beta hydrolase [Segniliparus sp.]|uniref:alpha/beta hydrolase n=1 Tax=Segniliparus sp. TaxID=2804064 RepID=UPI003F3CDC0F
MTGKPRMPESPGPPAPRMSERDQANRAHAADERLRLVAERDALPVGAGRGAARLWLVRRKLADLAAIADILDENLDARLLLLDARSEDRTMAAIALGDPDTADHVAVTTPGANVAVSPAEGRFADVAWTLEKLVSEARALKSSAEQIVERHSPRAETVAAIIWLGYQSPNLDGPDRWSPLRGRLDVYSTRRARARAGALSQLYRELAARRPAPHITAIGHSYGSLVTAFALRLTPAGVVDDAVFCGSPGILARARDGASQLNMASGHVYAMMADADEIRDRFALRRLKIYGAEPSLLPWVTPLDTSEGFGPGDGLRHAAPPSHGDYPVSYDSDGDGAADRLYMSGHNLACVVAGHAGLAAKAT